MEVIPVDTPEESICKPGHPLQETLKQFGLRPRRLSLLHSVSLRLPVSLAVKCNHTVSLKSVPHEQVGSTRGSPGLYQNQ